MDGNEINAKPSGVSIFGSSLLVLGNVLGVGVLALPITAGLGGFIPSLVGIIVLWFVMFLAALLIAYRIDPTKKNFDIPSFFQRELGTTAKWLAIACNLVILYGVLVAYLSGITTMIAALFPSMANYSIIVLVIYFCLAVSLIIFGLGVLRKGMFFLMLVLWTCFIIMLVTGLTNFDVKNLYFSSWIFLPICLPIAVSTFHFHNIIPTVSETLNYNKKATYKAIFIGVFIGLIINLTWVTVVLGTLPQNDAGTMSVVYSNIHGWAANVPMSELLKNHYFTIAGLIFSIIAVTCSFAANGAGLFGFIRDLFSTYFKTDNKILVSCVAFLPPLLITIIYPNLFLSALSIVGGIGEDILFAVLPAIVIMKIAHIIYKKKGAVRAARIIGLCMFIIGMFVLLYVLGQKFDLITLAPHLVK
ncbi:MAG: tryptophan/tyrosine permease [bacterium]|nr:tryptophan/tyrosine permease [bacterium]